jgi:hypothetical protein
VTRKNEIEKETKKNQMMGDKEYEKIRESYQGKVLSTINPKILSYLLSPKIRVL